MVNYGKSLGNWIEAQGFRFLKGFARDRIGATVSSEEEFIRLYNKLSRISQKPSFSSADWEFLSEFGIAKDDLEPVQPPDKIVSSPPAQLSEEDKARQEQAKRTSAGFAREVLERLGRIEDIQKKILEETKGGDDE